MLIQFLGTSAGIPTKTRNVSALALQPDQSREWYLVDCGEGTQQRLLHTQFSLETLSGVFVTHVHGDHCYGLPGLLATASTLGRKEPLTICAPPGIEAMIRSVFHHSQTFLNYELRFVVVTGHEAIYQDQHIQVSTVALSHRVPSFAYVIQHKQQKPKLNIDKLLADGIAQGPTWGEIQTSAQVELGDGRIITSADYCLPNSGMTKIICAGDNDTPSLLSPYVDGLSLLIHEATYTEAVSEKVGPGPQHSSAKAVASFAETHQLANLILTHFSARYTHSDKQTPHISEIENEAAEHYRGTLFLAKDLDVFKVDSQHPVVNVVPMPQRQ